MKRIALALATVALTTGSAFMTTFATWTDSVTVTNNVVQTGSVNLDVANDGAGGAPVAWNTSTTISPMVLTGLLPGAAVTQNYSFSLRNSSTSAATFTLTGQVTSSSIVPTGTVDKTQLMLQLYDTVANTAESAEVSLAAWEAGTQALTTTLAQNAIRNYGIRARLLSTALNEWQGQTVTFTLTAVGSVP